MAAISAPRPPSTAFKHKGSNPNSYPSHFPRFIAASPRCPLSPLKRSELGLCRCRNPHSGSPLPGDDGGWKRLESLLHDVVRGAVKRLDDCVNSFRKLSDMGGLQLGRKGEEAVAGKEVERKVWDWKRWERHFAEIEEEEWIVSVLKMQLSDAVAREDYEAAAKLKVALHAAKKSDSVGSAILEYNKAIAEERYNDAAFLQDNAGTGLLGWWAGISKDGADTYGRIAHISAEHGRYVARSYSSRQLAMSKPGSPLFEIYFTCDDEGYKQQAVYLKRNSGHTANNSKKSTNKSAKSLSQSNGSTEGPTDITTDITSEDVKTIEEVDDDSDWIDGLSGIKNILQDVIPGVKVKVLKLVAPGKVDGDIISKVIEQIIEKDEENDEDIHDSEEEYIKSESDMEEIEMVDGDETIDTTEEQSEVSVKFVIGTLLENIVSDVPSKDLVRVPAHLEIRDNLSFSFSVKKEDLQHETDAGLASQSKIVSRSLQRSSDHARSDLPKVFVSKEKLPIKVLVDIGELISLSINHNQNQLLVGTTHFNRIELPTTSDPLSGLYIGAHGMYTSELLHLKRRFGQWHEDDGAKKPKDLEFYEYVEAYKLTGALSIPAGQVVFRAKVGKKYQLPHKGIIPEEFGVIARYRAQGRLADPGFQNPRWVDGELVILDGKNIKGGPVIGFVYWAPGHHFLVFFNRLRLPD